MTNRWIQRARAGTLVLGISALLVTACGGGGGDGGGGPGGHLTKTAGDGQVAPVNTNVATAPAVTVTNGDGNPQAGVSVTFQVTGGGGAIGPANQTTANISTDANGVAAVSFWRVGTTAGSNT